MRNIPTVTKNLLILNVLAFVAYIIFSGMGIDLNNLLGLHFSFPTISTFGSL